MSSHARGDHDIIETTHNTARFFVENRHVAWVLLVMSVLWGIYGYAGMPKRKDPEVPPRIAVAVCPWPGASAERIEQLITRRIEERAAENARIASIESISRSNVSIVYITLSESVTNPAADLDDVRLKLDSIRDLPAGAGPIIFQKDFGDTAALTLTVGSPKVGDIEVRLRAEAITAAIRAARQHADAARPRATLVVSFPETISPAIPRRQRDLVAELAGAHGIGRDLRPIDGPGFVGIDLETTADDQTLAGSIQRSLDEQLHASEFHPDTWPLAVIRDPATAATVLQRIAGDRYSYRELGDFADLIKRSLQNVSQVSKVTVAGLLREQVQLEYSQELTAGMQQRLSTILGARNITLPGGVLELGGKNLMLDPSGDFRSEREIGDVIVGATTSGRPVYLRDHAEISRGYESPRYLNFLRWRDAQGEWHRSRAITLAVQMRPGEQIAAFGEAVDGALERLEGRIPGDLLLSRVSDQPLQVEESVALFTRSLYEAVVLVVVVALVGFWEWRSAALIALSIPLTLAMTFGAMDLLGLDIQQVSLASLIIALGLLVDDPVVAGDAIKRSLDEGQPPRVAAWLGPTKLANAILFATITNIVAYLPLLLVSGDTGRFLYSLPIVLTVSLVMSRIVSMTFIPLLGYYLLRPVTRTEPTAEMRRSRGFTGAYYRLAGWAVDHRWFALAASIVLLCVGALSVTRLNAQFFPTDNQYLSYVDVWLPEDATFAATNAAAEAAERVIQDVAEQYGKEHAGSEGASHGVLQSLSTFVGGGGPRFWFSVRPELLQTNYAQIIIKVGDKHDTAALAPRLQQALSGSIPGARIDVRQLETGKPVGIPVAVRLSGSDIGILRKLAESVKDELRQIPHTARVRDDWGAESFVVTLRVDSDRANLGGVTNRDVALSSAIALSGYPVSTLRDGDKQIPVVARLRPEERANLSDIRNLYVYSATGPQKIPLGQVSSIEYGMTSEKLRRRNQFLTVTVACFPEPGVLPSQVMRALTPRIAALREQLPPGYTLEVGGEGAEGRRAFTELTIVLTISILAIFVTLVFQFRHAVKPLIVFSAIPYGVVGSLVTLAMVGTPFGFMAFLGVASLIGVIVSHVIVLFDFIEEAHAEGAPLREALLDAGIVRLRPVLITVGATVFGLVPLAMHGGPLWEPLCYAQIGGLIVATFVTLLLVPVLYAIFVLDLKIVKWTAAGDAPSAHA